VPLHSVQRSHNRDAYLFGEDDYLAYPHGLGEALKESGYALTKPITSPARCGTAATRRHWCKKTPIDCCANAISSSTPYVPPWWTTRRTTVGAATLQTRWDNATP
jgi:hypothetical protein